VPVVPRVPPVLHRDAGLGAGDLVLTASSLGNPPFPTLAAAAAGGGFAGLSLWPEADYGRARQAGLSDRQLRRILDDSGLVVQDVDALVGWVGADDTGPPYLLEPTPELLFDAAEGLGARAVNVLLVGAPDASTDVQGALRDAAVERFGELCDVVAEHGMIATLECSSRGVVRTVVDAAEIVLDTGRSNARVLVDSWHHHWSGSSLESLRGVPGPVVAAIQLSDAPARLERPVVDASLHERLPPGRGVVDLVGLVRVLRDAGSTAPLTVEVFNDELLERHRPDALARLLGDATRAAVAEASRAGAKAAGADGATEKDERR
jgi:sugar phosphate isomerase/epimerase